MRLPRPATLRGQIILTIVVALAIAQALTLWLFIDQRALAVRSALALEAADRAGNIARLLQDAPVDLHPQILRAASSPLVQFSLAKAPIVEGADHPGPNWIAQRIRTILGPGNDGSVRVEMLHGPMTDAMPPMAGATPSMLRMHQEMTGGQRSTLELKLSISLPKGDWLNMVSRFHEPPYQIVGSEIATFIVTAALLAMVLWLALSRVVGPLQGLALAADRLGRGEDTEPLRPEGPEEMRRVASAFNQMQERLHRFVNERTKLLGAVGHDLRSPLTALRVRAEMVDDEETRDRMIATIVEMQEMVEATLAFARGMATTEPVESVQLVDFLGGLTDEISEAGGAVTLGHVPGVVMRMRRNAMRRAVRNLIENALRYGTRATVSAREDVGGVTITVEDEGPGIPPESLERVFDPFVRLETSRSRETGGIGLGLSIARTIVLAHGGQIALENRPEGGLRAIVRLPTQAQGRSTSP
ncbi:MAG: HAMP domain-containing protein [Paracoccaceae bacterium]|nr:HAMP domain-containing protein [Paracoccaceae bacterium]